MRGEFKDRAFLPVAIPVVALVVIGIVAVLFSRVLLSVPKEVAVAVAMMAAVNILVIASVVSWRKRLASIDWALLGGVALVPVIAGVAIAAGVLDLQTTEEPHEPIAQTVDVVAKEIAFDTAAIALTTDTPVTINLDNQDPDPHNLSIYSDAEYVDQLFMGEIFPGPDSRSYNVGRLQAGSYFFKCDVHPQMFGTISVEEAQPADAPTDAPAEPPAGE